MPVGCKRQGHGDNSFVVGASVCVCVLLCACVCVCVCVCMNVCVRTGCVGTLSFYLCAHTHIVRVEFEPNKCNALCSNVWE